MLPKRGFEALRRHSSMDPELRDQVGRTHLVPVHRVEDGVNHLGRPW